MQISLATMINKNNMPLFRGSRLILHDRHNQFRPGAKDDPAKQQAWNQIMNDAASYRNADEALDAYFKWEIEYKQHLQDRLNALGIKQTHRFEPVKSEKQEPTEEVQEQENEQETDQIEEPIKVIDTKIEDSKPIEKMGCSYHKVLDDKSTIISTYKKPNAKSNNGLSNASLEWYEDEQNSTYNSGNWTKMYYNNPKLKNEILLKASRCILIDQNGPIFQRYSAIIDTQTGEIRTNLNKYNLSELKKYSIEALNLAEKSGIELPYSEMLTAIDNIA